MQQIENYIIGDPFLVCSRLLAMAALSAMAVKDIRSHKISSRILLVFAVDAAIFGSICSEPAWQLQLEGMSVGIFFLIISRVTRERMGYGDSCLITALGIYLGLWKLLELLLLAWLLTAVAAGIVLAQTKFRKGTAIPMVPFITAAYAAVWIIEVISYA